MLELDGLRRSFGARIALDGLDLDVRPGELLGFVGPNGAGKTTAMRIALGVLAPDAGEVRWQGRPVDAAIRARFGYMPEERGLYPKMRVLDQVEHFARLHGLPGGAAREAGRRALAEVGLEGREDDATESLSLGNQQRAQLAVALVHDPVAMILDEPFSGLDPVGVDALATALRGRADAGVPVVFSSHQLDLVERLCDRIAIVRDGRLVARGTVAELRAARTGGRRWRVEVEGAPEWTPPLPGVEVVARDGGAAVVEVEGDEQRLLDAARAAGRVLRFAPDEPPLSELFREVLEDRDADDDREAA